MIQFFKIIENLFDKYIDKHLFEIYNKSTKEQLFEEEICFVGVTDEEAIGCT